MTHFLKDYIGLNGTHIKTMYMCEVDDIYLTFADTLADTLTIHTSPDANVMTNYHTFITIYPHQNIIIDSRMMRTITYIAGVIDDLIIYNTDNNELMTLSRFVMSKSSCKSLRVCDAIQFLHLYTFANYFVKTQWNSSLAIKCVQQDAHHYLFNSMYVPHLISYLEAVITKSYFIKRPKYVDIKQYVQMQDDMCSIDGSAEDVLQSLKDIDKNTHHILLNRLNESA